VWYVAQKPCLSLYLASSDIVRRDLCRHGIVQGLGAIHVLTGPDHLSALATLSANIGSARLAFWLGVRWGLGHSTGLLLVGVIFILLSRRQLEKENVEIPERMTHFFETIIGVYMLLLGLYGIHRACEKRHKALAQGELPTSLVDSQDAPQADTPLQAEESNGLDHGRQDAIPSLDEMSYQNHANIQLAPDLGREQESDAATASKPPGCFRGCLSKLSTQTLALLTGILHGLAGPGGVLAIIPAVQLRDAKLATIYLGSFCVSSTLIMGLYATIYGTCSSRLAEGGASIHHVFRIECGSSCLSLVVGVLWLVLLSIGKLDEVFP
jgi:uncharacterized membrane protein YfcA